MNEDRPVRELYEAINKQDLSVLDRIVSENVEIVDYGLDRTIRGREAFKNYFKNWFTAFPKGSGKITNLFVLGDQVVAEVVGQGEQSGPFETPEGRLDPTNLHFELHLCKVLKIKNGMIESGHFYSDVSRLFADIAAAKKAA